MKKKLLSLTLAMCIVLSLFSGLTFSAGAETEGYYTYEIDEGKATITGVDETISGDVTILSTLGGYPVTSIGSGAFVGCTGLTSVTIGNSVKTIGSSAFSGCTGLTSITIPDSVTLIGGSAFQDCKISTLTVANGSKSVTAKIIICKDTLKSITIPNSVTEIDIGAFSGCSSLEEITLPFVGDKRHSSTDAYQYPFGYIFGKNKFPSANEVLQYYRGGSSTSIASDKYFVPTSLKKVSITNANVISLGSFYKSNSIKEISLCNTITDIDNLAFMGCSSLVKIDMPINLKTIGENAFYNCNSLEEIIIPNSVTSIGKRAFQGCAGAKTIEMPSGLPSINSNTFYGCSSVKTINIPDKVTAVGDYAFNSCSSLETVSIGKNVLNIGDQVFSNCSALQFLTVNSGNTRYSATNNCIIDKVTQTLVIGCKNSVIPNDGTVINIGVNAFLGCISDPTDINIPKNIKNLGYSAFCNCAGIQSVIFEEGSELKAIPSKTFKNCFNLKSVNLPSDIETIGPEAFYGCNIKNIKIPESVTLIGENAFYKGEEKIFPDVNTKDWYGESVKYVVDNELMKGYANGKFGTSDGIQRQDFVIILSRLSGDDLSVYAGQKPFKDVDPNAYYATALAWAKDKGVSNGYNDGSFGVGRKVTREQIMTFLHNYAKLKGYDVTVTDAEKAQIRAQYSDFVSVSGYAEEATNWALKNGVISGKQINGKRYISPGSSAQRCEVAAMFYNIDQKGIFAE